MRTDCHRPSAFVPADYEPVIVYSLSTVEDGWPIPSIGVNCEMDGRVYDKDGHIIANGAHAADGHCCIIGLRHVARVKFALKGTTGQCTACGAFFVRGSVWKHLPSGEYIHLGHSCERKYEIAADDSAWHKANGRLREAAAKHVIRTRQLAERIAFLSDHEGLEVALTITSNHILVDLAQKFEEERRLSDKQVALAKKIAAEILDPSLAEKHVAAPSGRQTVRGTLVSVKGYDDHQDRTVKITAARDYNESRLSTFKATIKVATPDGSWLAWGTLPKSLVDAKAIPGDVVEVAATLKPGRDPHFAMMKRPSGGVVVTRATDADHHPAP
jgi:hypothetical protein